MIWSSQLSGMLASDPDVSVAGVLNVDLPASVSSGTGGTLQAHAGLNLDGGQLNLHHGTVHADTMNMNGGTLNLAGGTLQVETFNGDLRLLGSTLAPGDSAGQTLVNGDYVQESGATLAIDVGGLLPVDQFDRLQATGPLTLAGRLNVSLIDGFMPSLGQSFEIARSLDSIVVGTFTEGQLPLLAGLAFDLVYESDSVRLDVIGRLVGDANNDLQVTGTDLIAVQQNFASSGLGNGLLRGDANDDGLVTGTDMIAVQQNFAAAFAAGPIAAPLPEPATLAVLGTLFAVVALRRS